MLPFVSIVIPVKNEQEYIERCINSLLEQDYDQNLFELIIVDNGSTDRTISIVQHFINNKILLFSGIEGTIGFVRNFGVRKCKGEVIAFIDGDCVADKKWLRTAVELLVSDSGIGCVGFTDIERDETFPWVQQAWEHICSTSKCQGCCEVTWLSSFNLVLWRSFFDEVGGFNVELETCEDAELGFRMSKHKKIIMCNTAHVHHLGESSTLLQFFQKEFWRGKNNFKSFIRSSNKSHEFFSMSVPIAYLSILLSSILGWLYFPFISKNTYYKQALYFFTVITCSVPFLLTLLKSSKIKNIKKFLQVVLLMFVYLIARGLAIIC